MTIYKKQFKFTKKIKYLLVSLSVLIGLFLSTGVIYLSKVKIYEDILITYYPENNSLDSIEIFGKSVFDKEVVLSKEKLHNFTLKNYYLNHLILIMSDTISGENEFQLQINHTLQNIDLRKPDTTINNQNYHKLNYSTNKDFIKKIGYVINCNYVNFSNIFKERISKNAIIIFAFLSIISLFYYYLVRRFYIKKSTNYSKINTSHCENNNSNYSMDIARKNFLKLIKTLLIPFVLITFIILIDILIGIVYEKITPEFGRKNLKLALLEYDGINTSNHLIHKPNPYMTFVNTPYWKDENNIVQNNNLGYKDTEDISFAKESNCIRILALGGSTTYGDGVDKPLDTYPGQLERILIDSIRNYNKNYSIQVINGGISWGTSAELLNHYIFQDRYLSPDIVIIHSGVNDIQPALYKDYNPDYSNWRTIESGGKNGLRKGEGWIIKHSNIIKLVYTIWYSKLDYATSKPYIHTRKLQDENIEEIRKNANECDNSGFNRNIDLLIRNILNDGSKAVFFEEYVADFDDINYFKKPFNKKDKETAEIMGIILKKIEISAEKICKNYGIDYIYIENRSIPIEYMVDFCHLTKEGEYIKAKFVGDKILPLIKNIIDNSK